MDMQLDLLNTLLQNEETRGFNSTQNEGPLLNEQAIERLLQSMSSRRETK